MTSFQTTSADTRSKKKTADNKKKYEPEDISSGIFHNKLCTMAVKNRECVRYVGDGERIEREIRLRR